MEKQVKKLEQQLEEKEMELMAVTRALQAQEHHMRKAEDKVKLVSGYSLVPRPTPTCIVYKFSVVNIAIQNK